MLRIPLLLFPTSAGRVTSTVCDIDQESNRPTDPLRRFVLSFLFTLAFCGLALASTPTVTITSPLNNCNTCGPQVTLKATANFIPTQWVVWLDGQKIYSLSSTSSSFSQTITTTLGVWHTITVSAVYSVAGGIAYASATVKVYAPLPLAITTTSLPAAYTTISYSTQFTATGGTPPYTWSLPSGSLPPGRTMAATTGVISGTPTQAGSYSFAVKVTDSYGRTAQVSVSPSSKLAMVVHNSAINLTWIYTEPVQQFNVYRGTTSGGPYALIGTTTLESYIDRTFTPGKTYYFVVTAVAGGVESPLSAEIKAITW